MGVDIYTNSGILFTIEEAVERFFKLKKKDIESFKNNFSSEKRFDLDKVKTLSDLKTWFLNFASECIVKSDYDEYVNGEELGKVWNQIVKLELPEVRFEYFTNNRYSGYDVPTNTICVVFDDDGLFETKMTKEGKKVAKMMGLKDLQSTEWTVYSY